MLPNSLKNHQIILASKSPRRKQLLAELGIDFEVKTKKVAETCPASLQREGIALYLSNLKAQAFDDVEENTIVIAADTIVCIDEKVLNKPTDYHEAMQMLKTLSGRKHEVITAVCLRSKEKSILFYEETAVYFKQLTEKDIRSYIDCCKPFDKAGAYGIQEYLPANKNGEMVFNRLVDKIEGSYSNVVGLPLELLKKELIKFCN